MMESSSVNTFHSWMRSDRPDEIMKSMRANGWLAAQLPEVDRLYGIPQKPEHHPEIDVGIHIELVLKIAAELSTDPRVRYAALVHDLGKALTPATDWPKHFKHEALGVKPGLRMARRLGLPKDWRFLGALVAKYHLRLHRIEGESPRHIVRFLRDAGFFRHPEFLKPFVLACEADARGRAGFETRPYPQAQKILVAFAAASTVEEIGNASDFHSVRVTRVAKALSSLASVDSTFKPCD
jgi:tRNA nucleotidyltransferase (CCA-adding enzyme)